MRDYGSVQSTFWTSPTTHGMSDEAKLLSLYLIAGPHTNALGCFRLPDGYVMEDLQWSAEKVTKAFSELLQRGFATRCEGSRWVFIHSFLRFNFSPSPNGTKHVTGLLLQVPLNSTILEPLKAAFIKYVGPISQLEMFDEKPTPSEGAKKPLRSQTQTQTQIQTQSNSPEMNSGPAVIDLPLNTGKDFPVTQAMVDNWHTLYPAVNVLQELRKMIGWLESNPRNRKTERGTPAFINRWLAKSQDTAGRVPSSPGEQPQRKTATQRRAEIQGAQ